jgi:hypothetical protein
MLWGGRCKLQRMTVGAVYDRALLVDFRKSGRS